MDVIIRLVRWLSQTLYCSWPISSNMSVLLQNVESLFSFVNKGTGLVKSEWNCNQDVSPYCSHKLQPLHRRVLVLLKTISIRWRKSGWGKIQGKLCKFLLLVGSAYPLEMTPSNIFLCFRVAGLSPFSHFIFTQIEIIVPAQFQIRGTQKTVLYRSKICP